MEYIVLINDFYKLPPYWSAISELNSYQTARIDWVPLVISKFIYFDGVAEQFCHWLKPTYYSVNSVVSFGLADTINNLLFETPWLLNLTYFGQNIIVYGGKLVLVYEQYYSVYVFKYPTYLTITPVNCNTICLSIISMESLFWK